MATQMQPADLPSISLTKSHYGSDPIRVRVRRSVHVPADQPASIENGRHGWHSHTLAHSHTRTLASDGYNWRKTPIPLCVAAFVIATCKRASARPRFVHTAFICTAGVHTRRGAATTDADVDRCVRVCASVRCEFSCLRFGPGPGVYVLSNGWNEWGDNESARACADGSHRHE